MRYVNTERRAIFFPAQAIKTAATAVIARATIANKCGNDTFV